MNRSAPRVSRILFLLSLLAVLASCPKTRFPDPFFIRVSASVVAVDRPGVFALDAKCQSGEQLLGGSYFLDSPGSPLAVTASYPSTDDTRTVRIQTPSDPTFTAYKQGGVLIAHAYCFTTPHFPLDVTTTQAIVDNGTPFPKVTALCPDGSVLTGGGFYTEAVGPLPWDYNSNVMTSAPAYDSGMNALGWQLQLMYPGGEAAPITTVFARCARKNLSPATVVVQTVDLTKLTIAFGPHDFSVACPLNTFATAGGYWLVGDPSIPHYVLVSHAQEEFARWRVAGTWGYQTANYDIHPCDPNLNPDCSKFGIAAACIPIPNIPAVKVKITSPANGAQFDALPGVVGHQITAPITFTADATDEQGTQLTGNNLTWSLDGVPNFGSTETFAKPLPANGYSQLTISVTAIGKTTIASDQITISTGVVP